MNQRSITSNCKAICQESTSVEYSEITRTASLAHSGSIVDNLDMHPTSSASSTPPGKPRNTYERCNLVLHCDYSLRESKKRKMWSSIELAMTISMRRRCYMVNAQHHGKWRPKRKDIRTAVSTAAYTLRALCATASRWDMGLPASCSCWGEGERVPRPPYPIELGQVIFCWGQCLRGNSS